MERSQFKPFIAARVAQELHDGDLVNLGIGIPTLVSNYLPAGVHVTLQTDNGIIGCGPIPPPAQAEPFYLIDAGGTLATVKKGGAFLDSTESFALIRGGHLDCAVLSSLQVDEEGSLANWTIPGQLLPGMGGAMDLAAHARKVIIAMEHTAHNGDARILPRCTLPLTAVHCVDLIVTQMAVIRVTPDGLLLTEYNPEYTVEDIRSATAANLLLSPKLRPMAVRLPHQTA